MSVLVFLDVNLRTASFRDRARGAHEVASSYYGVAAPGHCSLRHLATVEHGLGRIVQADLLLALQMHETHVSICSSEAIPLVDTEIHRYRSRPSVLMLEENALTRQAIFYNVYANVSFYAIDNTARRACATFTCLVTVPTSAILHSAVSSMLGCTRYPTSSRQIW